MPKQWGASRGNALGYTIFLFFIKHFGLSVTYGLLKVVTLYYLFFPGKAKKPLQYYFGKRLGYSPLKTWWSIYLNFNYLGKSIIDKIILMSGESNPFSIEHDGIQHLETMVADGKGGLLVSAHLGNWEGAGHLLKRLNTKINIVMYEGEHEKIKATLDAVRERSFNVIVIKNDISHIYEINEALQRNEFVCIHADRYIEGNKTSTTSLLGADVQLPIGPFVLATTFQCPVSFVFAFKERNKHYHFFASEPKLYEKGKTGREAMLNDYVRQVEQFIYQYPLQWHNYFPYWNEEKETT